MEKTAKIQSRLIVFWTLCTLDEDGVSAPQRQYSRKRMRSDYPDDVLPEEAISAIQSVHGCRVGDGVNQVSWPHSFADIHSWRYAKLFNREHQQHETVTQEDLIPNETK